MPTTAPAAHPTTHRTVRRGRLLSGAAGVLALVLRVITLAIGVVVVLAFGVVIVTVWLTAKIAIVVCRNLFRYFPG